MTITNSVCRPQIPMKLPASGIKSINPDTYRWDSGLYLPDCTQYPYVLRWVMATQEADPEKRHGQAYLVLLGRPKDSNEAFTRLGQLTSVENFGTAWSGCIIGIPNHELSWIWEMGPFTEHGNVNLPFEIQDQTLCMAFTSATRVENDPTKYQQRIMLGYIDSNGGFQVAEKPLLDPQDPEADRLGYDTKIDSKVIQAWRDPYHFRDHEGKQHILFAAKYKPELQKKHPSISSFHPDRNSAIGHATFEGNKWVLQPPILLGKPSAQFELPTVVQHNGSYYMFMLDADWGFEGDKQTKRFNSLKLYKSESVTGPWRPHGRQENGKPTATILDFTRDNLKVYGVSVLQDDSGLHFSAFNDETVQLLDPFSMPSYVLDDPDFSNILDCKFRDILANDQ